jgi:hypothetical protein
MPHLMGESRERILKGQILEDISGLLISEVIL